MNDSLKYSPIIATLLFLSRWLVQTDNVMIDLVLKALILAASLFVSVSLIKKRNQHFFPFKVAWLSVFNILVLSSIIYGALLIVLRNLVFEGVDDLMSAVYIAFVEFVILEFLGIIISIPVALIMKK